MTPWISVARLVATAGIALVLLLSAGCTDSDTVPVDRLPSLVLQTSDLPSQFSRFDAGRQVQADFLPGPRADPSRFGRRDGWKARFRRRGDMRTSGPLVVESRADVFADNGGATDDLESYRQQYETSVHEARGAGRMLQDPDVGQDAVAMALVQPGNPGVQLFSVAWRQQNVTASVTVTGIAGRMRYAAVLPLVRAQAARIASP